MGKRKESPIIIRNRVNEILMKKPINYANYWDLCGKREDNFNEVYQYLLKLLDTTEGKTDNYINKLLTGILSYIDFFNKKMVKMNDEDKRKVLDFGKKSLHSDSSKDVIETINKLKDTIEKSQNTVNDCQVKDEHYTELTKLLDEKQKEIDNLKNTIKELENRVNSLNMVASETYKLQSRFNKLKDNLENLKGEYNTLKEQVESSKKVCESITGKSVTLSEHLDAIKQIVDALNVEIDRLKKENESLKNENNSLIAKRKKESDRKNRQKQLEECIIQILYENNPLTLEQLLREVNGKIDNCTIKEIEQALINIPRYYYISVVDNFNKTFPVNYGIYTPMYTTNGSLTIPCNNRRVDFIITSDWHLATCEDVVNVTEKLSRIYDYCKKNGINYLLNLGDLLEVRDDKRENQYYTNMQILEKMLKKFPQDANICHAILFGNHDKRLMTKCGIDLPAYLSQRTDFISLGFDFARVIIPTPDDWRRNIIGLHHPKRSLANSQTMSELPDNTKMSSVLVHNQSYFNMMKINKEINSYLNGVYTSRNLSREDAFMDFLGHLHSSQMYESENICLVPSLTHSSPSSTEGLIHLSVDFDSNHTIEGAVVTSLIDDDRLKPVSSVVYQKKKH